MLRLVPHACMPSPLPRQVQWKLVRSYIPIVIGLPRNSGGSAPASPFSRPARRSQRYGLQTCRVALATLYIGGFSSFVASTAAPIATGWNEPVPGWGFHPLWTNTFSRRTELTRLVLWRPASQYRERLDRAVVRSRLKSPFDHREPRKSVRSNLGRGDVPEGCGEAAARRQRLARNLIDHQRFLGRRNDKTGVEALRTTTELQLG